MTNAVIRKGMYLILIVSIVLTAVIVQIPTQSVYAQTTSNFENRDVMDDLNSSSIDGQPFDINDYPKDPYGQIQAITFVEYCYSFYKNQNNNYALYIYLYNPALINFDNSNVLNKIQIAVEFNDMDYASRYEKFSLKFCSKSSDGLFYKYKVVDPNNTILEMVKDYSESHAGQRQYYVSGVELMKKGEYNATEYPIAMNYTYSGFAEGYGDSINFPLTMTSEGIDTLQTEVHYTWWRPEGETQGGNHIQSQLNSVYFAVPNDLIEKYGVLQAVHMEWYEYITKEVFVVTDNTIYNKLYEYIGQKVTPYNESLGYALGVHYTPAEPPMTALLHSGYNIPEGSWQNLYNSHNIDTLYYLFKSDKSNIDKYILSSEELLDYIQNYKGTGNKINGKYYEELFLDYVDEGRQRGYNNIEIKADDNYSLTSYNFTQSWWQEIIGMPDYELQVFEDIQAIYKVKPTDILANNEQMAKNLFINEGEVEAFKSTYSQALAQDKSLYILRYAVTDYKALPVAVIEKAGIFNSGHEVVNENNYMFEQTVFLDLDLIDVTFYKDGMSTIIPVVASPIDGVADGTPPIEPDDTNWLMRILGIVLGIIILFIILSFLGPFLPLIFKGIVWIIMLPIRTVKAIIKSLKNKN